MLMICASNADLVDVIATHGLVLICYTGIMLCLHFSALFGCLGGKRCQIIMPILCKF